MHAPLSIGSETTGFHQNKFISNKVYQHYNHFSKRKLLFQFSRILQYDALSKFLIHSVKSSGHSILFTQTEMNSFKDPGIYENVYQNQLI